MTIIAATDYSPIAENAVAYAAAMAKRYHCSLLLFNAFELPLHASNSRLPASGVAKLERSNRNRLYEAAALIGSEYGIAVAYATSYSCVEDELQELVKMHNASLVVLGMAPESLEQNILGNTTTAAIAKMDFPVLAVPAGARFHGLEKMLFACDLADHKQSQQVLSDLKDKLGVFYHPSSIEIFHVDRKANEYENASDVLQEENEDVTYSYKNVQSGAVLRAIKEEIISAAAEILIMVPGKYGFWTSLAHRSKTRMMASGLNIPLLAVPA